MLALLLPFAASAQETRQYKLEAAFLYNFFNYITWPGADSPEALKDVTICIESGDPLANSLDYVKRKMAAQRNLTMRSWLPGGSAKGCQVLFVRKGALPDEAGVLTVQGSGNLRRGVMVALQPQGNRVGMRINNSLLSERGFTASSRLLTLAQEVK